MLLLIVSKISKEGHLTKKQKGVLKDLILDHDTAMAQYLQEYEANGDQKKLYTNFINLAQSKNEPEDDK